MIWRVVLFHLRRWLTWDQQFTGWIVAFKHFAVRAGVWSSLILQDRVEPSLHRHKREKVATMTVAIARVFAVPAQCQAHHSAALVVTKKLWIFFSCRPPHCPVDASSGVFCSTGGIQARRLIRRIGLYSNLVEQDTLIVADTTDNSESINAVYGISSL